MTRRWSADAIAARVLFADDRVIVLDKPAGLSVHAGMKPQDHLGMFLGPLGLPWAGPPRLGHRLDKDTSGCLALARTPEAAATLGRAFRDRQVRKTYLAIVAGCPGRITGTIDAPLRKLKAPGGSRVVADRDGWPSITRWTVLATGDGLSALRLEPETGRMHQLRAHMAILGHPILGDPLYGPERTPSVPLHLHAQRLVLPTPFDLDVVAPSPPHMDALHRRASAGDPSKHSADVPISVAIEFLETSS
jgi:tRNA pseudouridine32 synthase/23S rRNA pseudouridine746 synthase